MAKTKHYVGTLEERNGEREYDHQFLFKTDVPPEAYMDRVASTFFGSDCDDAEPGEKDGNGYFFDGGCLYVAPGRYTEVDKATYVILSEFITEL